MIVWGTLSVVTGVAVKCARPLPNRKLYLISNSFYEALVTRFFIGFFEAAFFPGALFILSKWYRRDEYGLRVALLYCGNLLSNAFGSLIASGVLDGMEGKLGRAAWR